MLRVFLWNSSFEIDLAFWSIDSVSWETENLFAKLWLSSFAFRGSGFSSDFFALYFFPSSFFSWFVICFCSATFSSLFSPKGRSSFKEDTLLLKSCHASIVVLWLSEAFSFICWLILSDDLRAWFASFAAFFRMLVNSSLAFYWYFFTCYYFCLAILSKFFFCIFIVYFISPAVFSKSGLSPCIFCFPSLTILGNWSAIFLRSFNDHLPFPILILK